MHCHTSIKILKALKVEVPTQLKYYSKLYLTLSYLNHIQRKFIVELKKYFVVDIFYF